MFSREMKDFQRSMSFSNMVHGCSLSLFCLSSSPLTLSERHPQALSSCLMLAEDETVACSSWDNNM